MGGGGRCIKSEDKVNISVYLFADAAVAAAAATTAMIAADAAEATRVVCAIIIYSNVFVVVASTCHHHEFEYPNSFLFFKIFYNLGSSLETNTGKFRFLSKFSSRSTRKYRVFR